MASYSENFTPSHLSCHPGRSGNLPDAGIVFISQLPPMGCLRGGPTGVLTRKRYLWVSTAVLPIPVSQLLTAYPSSANSVDVSQSKKISSDMETR